MHFGTANLQCLDVRRHLFQEITMLVIQTEHLQNRAELGQEIEGDSLVLFGYHGSAVLDGLLPNGRRSRLQLQWIERRATADRTTATFFGRLQLTVAAEPSFAGKFFGGSRISNLLVARFAKI